MDIVPPDAANVKGDPDTRTYRDAFARRGLETARRAKPAAFYSDAKVSLIETGNMEDDLERLAEVDWVLEAVTEKMSVKEAVFGRIAPHLKDTAILSSNTSGLSATDMAGTMEESLRRRFLITHFFNPPRYMYLLEIVPTEWTDPGVLQAMARFSEDRLGKGVVHAKDTPNFIANRIGVHSIAASLYAMFEDGYTPEEVDTLTGPAIGRPKSASLRTADLVGLDTLLHAAATVYDGAADDEARDRFRMPEAVEEMVKKGLLGEKSGAGFYRKEKRDGKSQIQALDFDSWDYRDRKRASFPSIELARSVDDVRERVRMLTFGKDRAAAFLWRTLSETMVYAANRLGEIADSVVEIDNAMKWGFNWELGPFELWDALGVEKVVERLESEDRTVPEAARKVLETPGKCFYQEEDEPARHFVAGGTYVASPPPERTIDLERLRTGAVLKKNAGASLLDLGDGVLCVEFHSKMNAIGADILQMIQYGLKETERNHEALVIANQGKNFSVGANIMLLLMEAQEGNWEEIDFMVRTFQRATTALKYAKKPVVAAPFAMTLGGGCEVCLGAGHVYAAAETYVGLVEVGVGLIPAGGGCKEMLLRMYEGAPAVDDVDYFPFVRQAFETIGMGKVATSAEDAKRLRFLRRGDGVGMNPKRLVYEAKQMALGLARQGYRPPDPASNIPVVGESGLASVKTHLYLLKESGFISEYDAYLGGELAMILCGGRVRSGTCVSEQYLLDLEREVFLRLCGQRKTQERIQHMLKKGRPLRN